MFHSLPEETMQSSILEALITARKTKCWNNANVADSDGTEVWAG